MRIKTLSIIMVLAIVLALFTGCYSDSYNDSDRIEWVNRDFLSMFNGHFCGKQHFHCVNDEDKKIKLPKTLEEAASLKSFSLKIKEWHNIYLIARSCLIYRVYQDSKNLRY